jgi:hypothetical protein
LGVLPIEISSGVDRDGQARSPRRWVMSQRGNDLVRRYLWMAALSAVRCNPAVRALYARVVAKHPQQKAVAVGHAMRKLLQSGCWCASSWMKPSGFFIMDVNWCGRSCQSVRSESVPLARQAARRKPAVASGDRSVAETESGDLGDYVDGRNRTFWTRKPEYLHCYV